MNNYAQAPTISIQTVNAEKPLNPDIRLYQGIAITKENLKDALVYDFAKYGISDQIETAKKVIACESSWNILASNKISYGLLQFTKPTWHDFGHGDIFNPFTQLDVAAKLWKSGQQWRWDCWRKLQ